MQNNYFANPRHNSAYRYHPYASQPYPVNCYVGANDTDFSSDISFGDNYSVPGNPSVEGRNNRFNGRGRFQRRGGFGQRGRGGKHQSQHHQSQHKPWMTDEILEAIRERNELQRKAEETGNPDDWNNFKAVRNRTNTLINDARRVYEMSVPKNEFSDSQGIEAKPSNTFYCDTCDRSFANDHLLQEHNGEHVVCQLDGCKFTAHPKIILKHIEMQHSNNLFNRVKGFETPEEIEKWKAERREKYPTPENMRKKEEELMERNKRGERFPLRYCERFKKYDSPKEFSRPNRNSRSRKEPYERRNKHGNNEVAKINSGPEKQTNNEDQQDVRNCKEISTRPPKLAFTFGSENLPSESSKLNKSEVIALESFYTKIKIGNSVLTGKKLMTWGSETQTLCQKIARTGRPLRNLDEEGSQHSDDCDEGDETNYITDEEESSANTSVLLSKDFKTPVEIIESKPTPLKEDKPKDRITLGLVAYSSDSDGEVPDELPIDSCREEGEILEDKISVGNVDMSIASNSVEVISGNTPPNATSIDGVGKSDLSKPNQLKKVPNPNAGTKSKPIRNFKKGQPRIPKLLKKLLENDIRQERNYILQVCRFIVENKFFEDHPLHGVNFCKKSTVEPVKKVTDIVPVPEDFYDAIHVLFDESKRELENDVVTTREPVGEGASPTSD